LFAEWKIVKVKLNNIWLINIRYNKNTDVARVMYQTSKKLIVRIVFHCVRVRTRNPGNNLTTEELLSSTVELLPDDPIEKK